MVLGYFVHPRPPAQYRGCGLENRATHLRHRTFVFSRSFLFLPANSPLLGAGGNLIILATSTVAQDCVASCVLFFGDLISPRPAR